MWVLAAVLAVFWQEFVQVVQGFQTRQWAKAVAELYEGDTVPPFPLARCGTIPTILVALLFKDYVEQAFRSTKLVGGTLILTGLILFLADRAAGKGAAQEQTLWDALWVGSGRQLPSCLAYRGRAPQSPLAWPGPWPEQAARFSFLLSIPSILGALVYSLPDLAGEAPASPGVLLAGMAAAGLTGYLAIRMLLSVVRRGRLVWFSYYTWFVGILVLVLA